MISSLPPFATENLVSRDGFGSPVPRQISILRLNLVLTYGIPPEFRGGVHLLSVHIMSYEYSSTYRYIICTMKSAALLLCSVSSTNEGPRIK